MLCTTSRSKETYSRIISALHEVTRHHLRDKCEGRGASDPRTILIGEQRYLARKMLFLGYSLSYPDAIAKKI